MNKDKTNERDTGVSECLSQNFGWMRLQVKWSLATHNVYKPSICG